MKTSQLQAFLVRPVEDLPSVAGVEYRIKELHYGFHMFGDTPLLLPPAALPAPYVLLKTVASNLVTAPRQRRL